jgi:hypothetical protein
MEEMCCVLKTQKTKNEEKQFTGAVNVKQNCVWIGVLRATTQITTSNLVAFFMYIYPVFS